MPTSTAGSVRSSSQSASSSAKARLCGTLQNGGRQSDFLRVEPAGVVMTVWGILLILFRGAFSRLDGRLLEWVRRRMPVVYALPGMRIQMDARTTVMFGVFFVITGLAVAVWG